MELGGFLVVDGGRWLRKGGQPYADFDRLGESSSYLFLSIHNSQWFRLLCEDGKVI